jgi:hypothetical protein
LASSNNTPNGTHSGVTSPIEYEKINEAGRFLPMPTKASSNDDNSIEYSKKFLPPLWVDLHEEIESKFEDIQHKGTYLTFKNPMI